MQRPRLTIVPFFGWCPYLGFTIRNLKFCMILLSDYSLIHIGLIPYKILIKATTDKCSESNAATSRTA